MPKLKKEKKFKVKTYELPEDEKYIVMIDPPRDMNGNMPKYSSTSPEYYAFLVYWLRAIFNGRHIVECVYGITNRSEVIVQLVHDVDIEPYFGTHYWQEILVNGINLDPTISSKIFAYNFERFGHPSITGQWREFQPDATDDNYIPKVRRPYPRAHYSAPSPAPPGLPQICHPLPITRSPTPPPEQVDVKKLDPYDTEGKVALSLLQPDVSIKPEPSNSDTPIKPEPEDIKPELEAELLEMLDRRGTQRSEIEARSNNVKREQDLPLLRPSASTSVPDPLKAEGEDVLDALDRALRDRQSRVSSMSAVVVKPEQGTEHTAMPLPPDANRSVVKRELSESSLAEQGERMVKNESVNLPTFDRPAGRHAKRVKGEDIF